MNWKMPGPMLRGGIGIEKSKKGAARKRGTKRHGNKTERKKTKCSGQRIRKGRRVGWPPIVATGAMRPRIVGGRTNGIRCQ